MTIWEVLNVVDNTVPSDKLYGLFQDEDAYNSYVELSQKINADGLLYEGTRMVPSTIVYRNVNNNVKKIVNSECMQPELLSLSTEELVGYWVEIIWNTDVYGPKPVDMR